MSRRPEIPAGAWAAVLAALILAACGGSTGPVRQVSLPGIWNLVGYSDHGVAAEEISGTMTFDSSGRFVTAGTVRYPDEPEDVLDASGTYVHDAVAGRLSLTTVDGTTSWTEEMTGDTLILTLVQDPGAPPPSVLRLLR